MTLKEQLEQGQYNVDTKKVADAIVRNPLWNMLLAADEAPHSADLPCAAPLWAELANRAGGRQIHQSEVVLVAGQAGIRTTWVAEPGR